MNYYLIVIILIIILIAILFLLPKIDKFSNLSSLSDLSDILLFTPNETINTIDVVNNKQDGIEIPLNIFMTWETKDLPINMKQSIEMVMSKNSEFNFYIYDDMDCRNFIKKYYSYDVVDAFDRLIPGAYKADLWRYCILYKYGGIYHDIKYQPFENFKYIELADKEYFVKDRDSGGGGIYNALMVCKPGNDILYKCIKQIVDNVKNKFYGKSALEPTGPLLMKKFITLDKSKDTLIFENINFIDCILKNNKIILKSYTKYRLEQKNASKLHYNTLWYNKNIYI